MKFVKLSVLALAMGLFVASCGNSEEATTETTDTTVVVPEAPAPVDTMATVPADTTHADTTAPAAH
jgi:ABC-type glycerol-3-phosphate transport system substrate-binding protein